MVSSDEIIEVTSRYLAHKVTEIRECVSSIASVLVDVSIRQRDVKCHLMMLRGMKCTLNKSFLPLLELPINEFKHLEFG